ncbi:probable serine/threonine-protein kinase samkC [Culicoides brevitarsis]|uniref:probable serine/threonine-protein kinase samkC n=1 Tax=Culicoides brevitarsis TaxID=469753 RepID=UPI00307BE6C6
MRRRKMNVLRNLQSFSQGFLAVFLLMKLCSFILAAEPGYLDFDNLPDTNFTCAGKVIGGYYADLETSCQMFHVCVIGQGEEPMDIKFLCLNGTVFDQETRVCERVDEVDCSKSERFYYLNLELYGNTMIPSPDDETTPMQSSTTQTTTTERITSTPASTSAVKYNSPSSTKTPVVTTRKSIPPTTQPSVQKQQQQQPEPEYIEEYYDYEEELLPSSKPITSSTRPPANNYQYNTRGNEHPGNVHKEKPQNLYHHHQQQQQQQQQNYQPMSNFKPSIQVQQQQNQPKHQHITIPKGQQYINSNPYSQQQKQQQQSFRPSLYSSSQQQQNYGYGRPSVTQPMLAEVSQPKPFEGYRRQPQPHVPLTFPQYGDVTPRQQKSVTLAAYAADTEVVGELQEHKTETKRSDPQYYTHIEPDASASDPNHQQLDSEEIPRAATISAKINERRDVSSNNNNRNSTQGSSSFKVVANSDNNSNEKHINEYNNKNSQHVNVSHTSYENKLKQQKNVYIPNLPKVINTVSVSVSDQNGKKLNLSLENILAEQQKNSANQRSYDDYKEDEISAVLLEPFFLDVQKLTSNSNKNSNNHSRNKQNIIQKSSNSTR